MENLDTPPNPLQIKDGKIARFDLCAASSLTWRGGGRFAVPFYHVQDCWWPIFSLQKRSTAYGNGVQYLSDLLDMIRNSSLDNAAALNKLQSGPGKTSASPCSPDGDTEDAEARARR